MDNKDDFWNIDRILPKKKSFNEQRVEPASVDVSENGACDFSSGVDISTLFSMVNEKKGINSIESAIIKERDYSHFKKSNVIIYAYVGLFNSGFSYENNFRQQALLYFDAEPECDKNYAEFFSFKPTYSELSYEQMNCYLNWRKDARAGVFNRISDSYILLYLSEIVNLPDKIQPQDGLLLIISVWENCLENKSSLDKVISDTVFEYCLVHDLPVPYERLEAVMHKSIKKTTNISVFYDRTTF